jgi:translation initiation factor 2 subunit 1
MEEKEEKEEKEEIIKMRFYEEKYPEVDQHVMVETKKIEETGIYVELLEYDNIEGMILLSEVSIKSRIRSIYKLVKVGRVETCVVLRVDKEKGYIDLSKKRISPEDTQALEIKYNRAKKVNSILRNLSQITKVNLEDLYRDISWPLYKKFGHCFDAFKLLLTEEEKVFKECKIEDENIKKELLNIVQRKFKKRPVKIRADIEVTCFSTEGILAIKEALKKGESFGTEDIVLKIQLVSPPLYVIGTLTTEEEKGIKIISEAIEAIKENILEKKGTITVKAHQELFHQKKIKIYCFI